MAMNKETKLRKYHGAQWDEELVFDLSVPGERGILVPEAEADLADLPGASELGSLARKEAPGLPEVNQHKVVRHYTRLSQEASSSVDATLDISEGTCTTKYNPKVQDACANLLNEIHPLQDTSTMQGLLEMFYETEQYLKAISGLDAFSLQPGAGGAAVYTAGAIMRAYHRDKGNDQKTEIITTSFSHPVDSATPAHNGFKVITLPPDEEGYPSLEALKAAVNEKTAGLFITNPEDTGLYNARIKEYVDTIHENGGLCFYDQANANGMLGVTRAREAGFDLCHFNLHKTFAAPHGCFGPACGAIGCRDFLAKYLPVPHVVYDGENYDLDYDCPDSIGKVRSFFGNAGVVARAYMWIRTLGPDGLKAAAICAVLNNNYLEKALRETRGIKMYYGEGKRRLEQVRYSWQTLKEETGFGLDEVTKRVMDFGIPDVFMSHPPYLVPEPMTLEPSDSYDKDDLDEYIAVMREASREAYEEPELLRGAPWNVAIHRRTIPMVEDTADLACTLRTYKKNMADRINP